MQKKTFVKLIVAALVATISFSFLLEGEAATGTRFVVDIEGFEFRPETPVVKPGDVIVWMNRDIVSHTVSAEDGSWDSGQIKAGGSWETVVEVDTFKSYFCQFHPSMVAGLDIVAE